MTWEDPELRESAVKFKIALVDTLVAWNRLEGTARYLTEILAGANSREIQALVAHIPNQTLANTMQALSHGIDDETVDHVTHFCLGFSRLGAWRNYYIHGIQALAATDQEAVGFVNEVDTKSKKLTAHEAFITTEQLATVRSRMEAFNSYASAIIGHVYDHRGTHLYAYAPLSSLQKPDTPDQPNRDRLHLLSREPRPEPLPQ